MAGIGFELRRILGKGSYLNELGAYLYAALISSGPWLMSIFTLSVLGLFREQTLSNVDHEIFRATIIYTYAFSLVFVGFFQLISTRYLADELFLGRVESTMRAFWSCCAAILCLGVPLATAAYLRFEISGYYKLLAVMLFAVVSLIWLAMVFISSVKDYIQIVLAFAIGTAISIAGAIWLSHPLGAEGHMLGYLIGQAIIFYWLFARLLAEFQVGAIFDRALFSYFKKYWELAVIGIIYNLAIWIDKIVFWFAPDSRTIVPYFRTHDLYEGPIFFAYLTIVPTLAIFLMKVETSFYDHYKRYYAKVLENLPFYAILEEKGRLVDSLHHSLREILIIQGAITTLCIAFAPEIIAMAQLSPIQTPVYRIALTGAFLQVLLSVVIIILFYFDLRKEVLIVSSLFLVANGLFSWITTNMGAGFYGYGYCYSCFVALFAAYWLLDWNIRNLEYITFARQPIG
ncbi:exopolysaccharide Pel transporter PelG [Desulfovibrio mangrovi]|uniref:exopolysaccharide Pel transporter PelG n=1 Tax=Desulfovibrio mangrovi TaxID=2976983 RepID=UPI002246EEB2|nr:exopolysaccharide Pel transporter PelG [Desulfovibrio mangrovi]UZP67394.1 exopolysaccharide Pel transporter PelG [Desulfovibrio mangrovi]